METLALNTTNRVLKLSNPQTHLIKSPIFPYNSRNYDLCNKRIFPFRITTCKLAKTSKDAIKNKNVPIKIVGPDEKAPLLPEEGGSAASNGGAQSKPRRKKAAGGLGLLLKRFPKKVLSILSNLPLAIGEMFTIAGLMALGMYQFVCLKDICDIFLMGLF